MGALNRRHHETQERRTIVGAQALSFANAQSARGLPQADRRQGRRRLRRLRQAQNQEQRREYLIGVATRYRLYGLTLESSVPLPCLRIPARGRPDVRLGPGRAHRFDNARRRLRLPLVPRDWFDCGRFPDGTTFLRWENLFEFLISPGGRAIAYRRLQKATHESLTTYLLGQVLSFSLLSFGREPLHSTAVVIKGEAVGFLGDCGWGKSTLGAAFVSRGFHLLTDDVLALEKRDGAWAAHAGPPRLKLFPSVARKILARGVGYRLNAGTSKLVLRLSPGETCNRVVPLRSLYVLGDPARGTAHALSGVAIAPLGGEEAFLEVIRAAFNLIRVDRPRLANQFEMASQLVHDIPMRRLGYPRTLRRLGDVCEAVIADAEALRRPQSRTGTAD